MIVTLLWGAVPDAEVSQWADLILNTKMKLACRDRQVTLDSKMIRVTWQLERSRSPCLQPGRGEQVLVNRPEGGWENILCSLFFTTQCCYSLLLSLAGKIHQNKLWCQRIHRWSKHWNLYPSIDPIKGAVHTKWMYGCGRSGGRSLELKRLTASADDFFKLTKTFSNKIQIFFFLFLLTITLTSFSGLLTEPD